MDARRFESAKISTDTGLSIGDLYARIKDERDVLKPEDETRLQKRAVDFESAFSKIDKDRNGYMSARELNSALENPATEKDTIRFVTPARVMFDRLSQLHRDHNNAEISRADMAQLVNVVRSYISVRGVGVTDDRFHQVDANRDGKWSVEELRSGASNSELSVATRYIAGDALENANRISGYSREQPSFLTRQQVKNYYQEHDSLALAFERGIAVDYKTFETPAKDKNDKPLPLFAKPADDRSIRPEIALQADAAGGNCQFVAALQSLSHTNKTAIRNMIRENSNDTFTVTFPAYPKKQITVSRPSDYELNVFMSRREIVDSAWPYVLQKAYGRLTDPSNVNDYKGASEGSSSVHSLRALTASNVCETSYFPAKDLSTVVTKIDAALKSGLPVTLGTPPEEGKSSFTQRHAYAVLSVEANPDDPGKTKVLVQSTHGALDHAEGFQNLGDGKYNLTMDDINRNFLRVILAQAPRPRITVYNWTDVTGIRDPLGEATGIALGGTAALAVAAVLPKTGAAGLGAWSSYELAMDGLTAYNAEDSAVRNKYLLGAGADAVMLGGFGSRLFTKSKYGLAIGAAGFATRWAIEKFK